MALVAPAAIGALTWSAAALPLPSPEQRADLGGWYEEVGPGPAVMLLVRLVATGLAGWLVVAAGLQLLASAWPQVRSIADAVTPSLLRGFAGGMASLSLGVVTAPDLGAVGEPGTAVLQPIEADGGGTAAEGAGGDVSPSVAELRPIDETSAAETTTSVTVAPPGASPPTSHATPATTVASSSTSTTTEAAVGPVAQHPPAPPATPVAVAAPSSPAEVAAPADRHIVVAGDHFWALAQELVTEAQGGEPTEREVARYWRVLVDANQHRLAVPGDSDLLYVGQELVLPPVP